MRKVPLAMLTPDMQLGKAVCLGTNVLINAGTRDLNRYASRLQRLGISHLYIEDAACEGIDIDDLISDQTKMKCKKTLEKSFKQLKSYSTLDIRQISGTAEDLLDEIMSHSNFMTCLNDIGGIGDNTLDHSLNTTIYAICLALQLGYNKSKMLDLAKGTLLHDIGKTLLDSTILFKPDRLTEEEFEHVKQHSKLGYELLNKNRKVPESSMQIALQHHERMDGSGYPFGIGGNQLSEFTRISSIVDVYEALTVNRCYHRSISPLHAMDILVQESTSKLDLRLVSIFMKNIAVYPNGTTVILSTGQYGVVKAQNPSLPLRPKVRVVAMENGKCVPKEEIDLLSTLNITISDSDVTIPR